MINVISKIVILYAVALGTVRALQIVWKEIHSNAGCPHCGPHFDPHCSYCGRGDYRKETP